MDAFKDFAGLRALTVRRKWYVPHGSFASRTKDRKQKVRKQIFVCRYSYGIMIAR